MRAIASIALSYLLEVQRYDSKQLQVCARVSKETGNGGKSSF